MMYGSNTYQIGSKDQRRINEQVTKLCNWWSNTGGLAAAVSASPLTGADVILGAAILGAIGYAIGRKSDSKS